MSKCAVSANSEICKAWSAVVVPVVWTSIAPVLKKFKAGAGEGLELGLTGADLIDKKIIY